MIRNIFFSALLLVAGCTDKPKEIDKEKVKQEVVAVEKEFATFLKDSGVAAAFHKYAAEDAVIKRASDSLIHGKEAIKQFYSAANYTNAVAEWAPDFVNISEDGTMAYTYGRYKWYSRDTAKKNEVYTGIFHTVWKKMDDGTWKYVWD